MLALVMAMSPGQSGRQDDIIENYIEKIAEGSKAALSLLYEQTHSAVYGFALSILKNRQDAEDVEHDTYIQVWRAASRYVPEGKPLAWIFTITRNLALMRLRERKRVVAVSPEDWQSMFADETAADQENRQILELLLETLSDEERQIVVLHAMTGLKHREIAELLQLGLPTVLSKYNRALKKLRKAWKEAE